MKLGLHLRYPRPRPDQARSRSITVRRCVFRHCSILPFSQPLPPFPMCAGFPRLGVLQRLRPVPNRSAVGAPNPTAHGTRASRARSGTVPVFTEVRSSKEEPDYAPATSLRVRRRPSPQPPRQLVPTAAGVPRSHSGRVRTASSPYPPGSSWCLIKGLSHAGSSRTPLRPASRTQAIWQC